ncbi:MAG: hypothetical protein Q8Q85_04425 [Gemmatimonadales bacterium]|nr:hypothetical protein [Gemmatimonadales bacterium]
MALTTTFSERPLRAFELDPSLRQLSAPYPEPRDFIETLAALVPRDVHCVVRLWLTEGIPFIFRPVPALYDVARSWLAGRLQVEPKAITIIGSARIGFSLAPPPQLGTPVSASSDLDFSVVSADLFSRVAHDFETWAQDYKTGAVVPANEREHRFWDANLEHGPRTVARGFLDPTKLVPTHLRYCTVQCIGQAMWALGRKLQLTDDAPEQTLSSLSVYRDWRALVNRLSTNLAYALSKRT